MKKGLSLKKKIPKETPKDQLAITNFFKKPADSKPESLAKPSQSATKRKTSHHTDIQNKLLHGKYSDCEDQKVPSDENSPDSKPVISKKLKISPLKFEKVVPINSLHKSPLKPTNLGSDTKDPSQKPIQKKKVVSEFEVEKDAIVPNSNCERKIAYKNKSNAKPENDFNECNELANFVLSEWNENDLQFQAEELDLTKWQRCTIIQCIKTKNEYMITVKDERGSTASCKVSGTWADLELNIGTIVSIIAAKESNEYVISNNMGLLSVWPDHLLSSTSIVGSVFCSRRAVLQESFRGFEPANRIMTVGSLVHELLQNTLQHNLKTVAEVKASSEKLLTSYSGVHMLFDADMTYEEGLSEMDKFVPQIVEFVNDFVGSSAKNKESSTSVLDIEENVYCHTLGVKGKIDVTLQVKEGKKQSIVPLELKTGRASMSAEHRGQLILYGMMLAVIENAKSDPKLENAFKGMLLYLREKITFKDVKCGYPERRDLLMLRNQLVQYVHLEPTKIRNKHKDETRTESKVDPSDVIDLEDLALKLPAPINHHSACGKCPYLTICSMYLWNTADHKVTPTHPLSKIKDAAIGHLNDVHVNYLLHWIKLLLIEEADRAINNPLSDLWTKTVEEREQRGKCLSGMLVQSVRVSDDRFIHNFVRKRKIDNDNLESSYLIIGEYVIVSKENRVNIASGTIVKITSEYLQVSLERDLTRRNSMETIYSVESYDSQSLNIFNFTNLGALLDNTETAGRLRRLIIEKETPTFKPKLHRTVSEKSMDLLRGLNPVQQRAVLRAIAAEEYLLIRGMPGTGKTQTVSVLIQMLVALGQSVIVTSQTHSAIDNVLVRLPTSTKLIRLGPTSRIHPDLLLKSEEALTSHFKRPSQLVAWMNSAAVVGVTCLGASHSVLTKRTFDVCIVDESTQVLQPTVLRALFAAKKFILIGDPEQLPPIVRSRSARKLGMDVSLFEHLDGPETVNLTLQYRMNKTIEDLANRYTYKHQLKCANESITNAVICLSESEDISRPKWLKQCLCMRLEKSVQVIDTGSTVAYQCNASKKQMCENIIEAKIVLAIAETLSKKGLNTKDIGVITPYRDQVSLLTKTLKHLHDIEVNTVDQYQGRDKDVIIYSCCKTWNNELSEFSVKESEILEDKRRLTVAITRAKKKLILIGDVETLKKYSTFGKLFNCLEDMSTSSENNAFIKLGIEDISAL